MPRRILIAFIPIIGQLLTVGSLFAQSDTLRIIAGSGSVGSTGNEVPVYLVNNTPVAGIQFSLTDVSGYLSFDNISTTPRTENFSVVSKNNRVLLYNLRGESISPGAGPILTLKVSVADFAIAQVDTIKFPAQPILSNPNAHSIEPVVAVPGIFEVTGTTVVELVSFSASPHGDGVILKWQIPSQKSVKGFEIQRSRNGRVFSAIAYIPAGQGTATFRYADADLEEGEYFYKLFQVNANQGTIELGSVNALIIIPQHYSLEQNYPNPFAASNGSVLGKTTTKIGFSLKESGLVRIKVFNLLGKEVAIIVDRKYGRGRYSVDFDAKNMRSGVYIYKMEVNNFVAVKKMLIVR